MLFTDGRKVKKKQKKNQNKSCYDLQRLDWVYMKDCFHIHMKFLQVCNTSYPQRHIHMTLGTTLRSTKEFAGFFWIIALIYSLLSDQNIKVCLQHHFHSQPQYYYWQFIPTVSLASRHNQANAVFAMLHNKDIDPTQTTHSHNFSPQLARELTTFSKWHLWKGSFVHQT